MKAKDGKTWMKPISDMHISFWFYLSYINKLLEKNYLNHVEGITGLSVCEGTEVLLGKYIYVVWFCNVKKKNPGFSFSVAVSFHVVPLSLRA